MYNVSADFHTLAIQDAPQTRVRIYFIDGTVDCTDDNDVQTNGTLLVGAVGDTDSNARISQDGIQFREIFNRDLNLSVGGTVSYQIALTFNNSDGLLNYYPFGRCKVYLDVYDAENLVWLPCPMGVYNIETPSRRKIQLISATGYDQMQTLDTIADSWWNGLDWVGGITMLQIIQLLAGTLGITLSAGTTSNIINSSVSYTEQPFESVQMTYRDILAYVAEATGTIARFDRDGALDLRWYAAAQIGGNTIQIDTDTVGNQCLSIDLAEYTVAPIDAMEVKSSDSDIGAVIGTGNNTYYVVSNPLLGGVDSAAIIAKATPIYNRLNGLAAFNPTTIRAIVDWSIEAGDIIEIVRDGDTYTLPIFQQTLSWRGGFVISDLMSSGNANRPTQTGAQRAEYRSQTQIHQFKVDIDRLLSRIESINGNYTQIQQTVDAITQTVSAQGVTIQNILDPTGEIWTAIQGNTDAISDVSDSLNDEIDTRQSYIRFIPSEPAIVLGVDTGNEIKLKLVNNVIYFFSGADDSTDLSLAYAYFNSKEAGADRFVASESVQVGHWIWKVISNGNYVLDYVQ